MRQTHDIIEALKRCLKARGITYRELARRLHLSEASIKRLFAEEKLSLERLEAICDVLDMRVVELMKMTPEADAYTASRLTLAQEQMLASSPRLLTFFYLLNNGWTLERIAREYGIEGRAARACIARLVDAELVAADGASHVQCLTKRRIDWRPGGPVVKLYEAQAKSEFLKSEFDGPQDAFAAVTGELSPASVNLLRRKLQQLNREFDELVQADRYIRSEQRHSVGLLMAFRPWSFSVVSRQRVRPDRHE